MKKRARFYVDGFFSVEYTHGSDLEKYAGQIAGDASVLMKFHRIIWIVATLAVLAAAATLLVRNEHPAPDTINALFAQLENDPSADNPETKTAIKQAAEAALLESTPTAEDCYALGLYHSDQQAFDTAETDFREAITLNPGWSWPYNALGVLLANHAKNRTSEAEELFRTAIQLDPQSSRPYNDIAILLRIAGRLDEAEQMASAALRLDPENAEAQRFLTALRGREHPTLC